jgi:hypothetical protein
MFGKRPTPPRGSSAPEHVDHKVNVEVWKSKYEQLRKAADEAIQGQAFLLHALHQLSDPNRPTSKDQAEQLAKDAATHAQRVVGYYESLKTIQDKMQGLFDAVDTHGPIVSRRIP